MECCRVTKVNQYVIAQIKRLAIEKFYEKKKRKKKIDYIERSNYESKENIFKIKRENLKVFFLSLIKQKTIYLSRIAL